MGLENAFNQCDSPHKGMLKMCVCVTNEVIKEEGTKKRKINYCT